MNIKYGINGSLSVDATRPITIKSTTAVAKLNETLKKLEIAADKQLNSFLGEK